MTKTVCCHRVVTSKSLGLISFLPELTFIVLYRDELPPSDETQIVGEARILTASERDDSRIIGDVNLFFKGSTTDEDFEVEAEVMIAGVSTRTSHRIDLR